MKNYFFIVLYILLISHTNAVAYKVAVFDFDDRLNKEQTTAKYLENELKQADKDILVYQFSGRGDVTHSVKIMKELDNGGYNLIIIITSDALIIAHHVIKKLPPSIPMSITPCHWGTVLLVPRVEIFPVPPIMSQLKNS